MVPERAIPIIGNLLHSIKLIASKALPTIPISGNVKFEDPWKNEGNQTQSLFDADTALSNKDIANMFNQSYLSSTKLMKQKDYLYSES